MRYSLKALFDFMESGRRVKVTTADGKAYTGRCWAYSSVDMLESDGVEEDAVEVQDVLLFADEIEKIEYID